MRLAMPAGARAAKLNAAIASTARSDDFRKRVEPEGIAVSAGAPAELDQFVRAEEAHWRRIVRENNIRAD